MANPSDTTVTVFEHYRVSPPPGSVAEKTLPLTFLDVVWLHFHPIRFLIFYDFPYPKTYFTQTVFPNLKAALSLVLKHFFPLAGNLIIPSTSSNNKLPEIRYMEGDSVSLTFAECCNDFSYLVGHHPRYVDELFPLAPKLPPHVTVTNSDDASQNYVVSPLLALQVTLFPNHGMCVGFTMNHVVGDASTMYNFRSTWASVAKELLRGGGGGGDDVALFLEGLGKFQLPFYDRSVIKDPKGIATIFWSQLRNHKEVVSSQTQAATTNQDQVRATFVMSGAHIQGLKNLVTTKRPKLSHVSSFTVVCAYVWSCMAKTRAAVMNSQEENEIEHLVFAMNCRARLDPPVPRSYFGNCVAPCWATRKNRQLIVEEGFVSAAEAIGEAIQAKVQNEEGGVLKGAEMWIAEFGAAVGQRLFGVAGSPNFDFYGIDFGWGKPKKVEVVSEKFSLFRAGGDLEIGICFSKNEMDAFSTIFTKGLFN